MTPDAFAKKMKLTSVSVRSDVFMLFDKYMTDAYANILRRSPVCVDKKGGKGGRYKGAWQYSTAKKPHGTMGMVTFSNNVPYAIVLEKGSTPGNRPWPSKGPRTVVYNGKIFSSQAPGGVAEVVFEDAIPKIQTFFKVIVDKSF